jgi:hypothetical protein
MNYISILVISINVTVSAGDAVDWITHFNHRLERFSFERFAGNWRFSMRFAIPSAITLLFPIDTQGI